MPTRPASLLRTLLLTAVTMVFFAANSVLARLALREDEIDGGSFTAIRICSGAAALAFLVGSRGEGVAALKQNGSWPAALALFGYAVVFSFAYLSLDAGMGALILFAAVQITMIGVGMKQGERPRASEWLGLSMALMGLIYLVSPGLTAPPLAGAGLMAVSGMSWGAYSLAGKGVQSPTAATAGNFLRAVPMATIVALAVWVSGRTHASSFGIVLATISGAVTSGLGYVIWYMALRSLTTTRAAIVQLTVPIIAAVAGVVFLGEQMTWRLVSATGAILGGVTLALLGSASPVRPKGRANESVTR